MSTARETSEEWEKYSTYIENTKFNAVLLNRFDSPLRSDTHILYENMPLILCNGAINMKSWTNEVVTFDKLFLKHE